MIFPEILTQNQKLSMMKDLIIEIGEGDVKTLLFNLVGKIRVDEHESLQLLDYAITNGWIEVIGVQDHERKKLTAQQTIFCMIFDRPADFKSLLPDSDHVVRRKIRENIIRSKLKEKLRNNLA